MKSNISFSSLLKTNLFVILAFCSMTSFSQEISPLDNKLDEEFIASRGYSTTICFDASNIKQFWIDKSVVSKDNLIHVYLNEDQKIKQSVPLNLKFINLDQTQLCKIDVITDETDLSYSITNDQGSVLATATNQDDFNDHHVISTSIDFRDTEYTLNFLFESSKRLIFIRSIILSFTPATSRRSISISQDNAQCPSTMVESDSIDTFMIQGKQGSIYLKDKIVVAHRCFTTHATIKNIGDNLVRVRLGYLLFSSKGIRVYAQNYPYNNNLDCIKVVSADKDNDFIITTDVKEWTKNCCIAETAKEDASDIPNTKLLEQTIVSVENLDNNQSKIKLSAPLSQEIAKGELIRITNPPAGTALYANDVVLKPGEETVLTSTIKKDYSGFEFSPLSIPKGVYYVVPLVISNNIKSNEVISVVVSDFSISY